MTRVLMISTDAKMLEEGSSVRARMIEYGDLFSELHIVLFSLGKNTNLEISKNVFVYPTNSVTKLLYVMDAIKIGSLVIEKSKLFKEDSVITTQDPFETGIVGEKLSKKSGINLHVQAHTDFYSSYFKESILNKIRIGFSTKTLPAARAIRAVSQRIKNSLSRDLQEKTSVLPIFADLDEIRGTKIKENLREKYPQFKKIILMASRLTQEKDIQSGIEAFSSVLGDFPDTGLIIVGSGPLEDKIKKAQIKNPSIIHLPWVSLDILFSYMKTCDIFLSTSLYEGYGLSMLEAHAAGATLVATDAGLAPLLAGAVAKPGDTVQVARLLRQALSGELSNKPYSYPYSSRSSYMAAYKADIERAL